jgi:hypothetical protein
MADMINGAETIFVRSRPHPELHAMSTATNLGSVFSPILRRGGKAAECAADVKSTHVGKTSMTIRTMTAATAVMLLALGSGTAGWAQMTNKTDTTQFPIGGGSAAKADTTQYPVGGGSANRVDTTQFPIGGGSSNKADTTQYPVGGGSVKKADSTQFPVGGGSSKKADTTQYPVGGGSSNKSNQPK